MNDATTTTDSGLIVGDDGRARPEWASSDPLLGAYYDEEWGMPVRDERGVFERLALESFQSGLSWSTVLRKRPAFRAAFADFDVDAVARFDDDDVERLLGDAEIIRNRRKIEATIANARAARALRDDPEAGDLGAFVWRFRPERTPMARRSADVPSTSPESVALAKELKRRGFQFVGPTTMYALMQAIGIVDAHVIGSHRRGCSGLWNEAGAWVGEQG